MAEAITHRRVLRIAVPIVLSNATVPILGAVDTGVVGQLGEAAPIGAVGLGAVVLTSVYWVFGFIRMGTTGLTSQARGAGDSAEVAAMLTRALLIGGAAGLAMILLQQPIFRAAGWMSPASDEVESLARAYMGVRIWSAPAAIGIWGITGWLIALERGRAVLIQQLWMNGANIVLDVIFVLHLDMGVEGVAFATFLSEWSGLALGLWLARDAFAVPAWRDWARVFDRVRLTHIAVVNTDIMLRSVLLLVNLSSFTFFAAAFDDTTLAADQILLQFLNITAYAMDGFAFAAEAIVGQALGARSRETLRRGAVVTSQWGLASGVALALAFGLWGGAIIDVMTTAPEVRQAARDFLPWMVASPIVGGPAWMLDGIFIGATRTRDMRNMMALSLAIYLAAVAVLMPAFGNHGLWAAMMVGFLARGATLGIKYPGLERAAA